MADSIVRRVNALVRSLGALDPEQAVHAAAARRIAEVMEGDEAPLYALPALARELRNAVATLTGGSSPLGQGLATDEALDALLRGMS